MANKREMITKTTSRNQLIRRWLRANDGLIKFDFGKRDVIFTDGGMFSFKFDRTMQRKMIGFQQKPNGEIVEVLSKKKYPSEKYSGAIWFGEIDNAAEFFKSLKKLLNKLGYDTSGEEEKE